VSDKNYQLAPCGTQVGKMVCAKCGKKIDHLTQDYVYWQKTTKWDWHYVMEHRRCHQNQQGWVTIENAHKKHAEAIEKATKALNELDWPVLYAALEESKHSDILS
jgi:hypothetical protein